MIPFPFRYYSLFFFPFPPLYFIRRAHISIHTFIRYDYTIPPRSCDVHLHTLIELSISNFTYGPHMEETTKIHPHYPLSLALVFINLAFLLIFFTINHDLYTRYLYTSSERNKNITYFGFNKQYFFPDDDNACTIFPAQDRSFNSYPLDLFRESYPPSGIPLLCVFSRRFSHPLLPAPLDKLAPFPSSPSSLCEDDCY